MDQARLEAAEHESDRPSSQVELLVTMEFCDWLQGKKGDRGIVEVRG